MGRGGGGIPWGGGGGLRRGDAAPYIRLKTLRRRLRQGREKRRRFRGPQRAVAKQAEVQAFRRGLAMRIWGMMVVEKSY